MSVLNSKRGETETKNNSKTPEKMSPCRDFALKKAHEEVEGEGPQGQKTPQQTSDTYLNSELEPLAEGSSHFKKSQPETKTNPQPKTLKIPISNTRTKMQEKRRRASILSKKGENNKLRLSFGRR